jgi:hypothetical protein
VIAQQPRHRAEGVAQRIHLAHGESPAARKLIGPPHQRRCLDLGGVYATHLKVLADVYPQAKVSGSFCTSLMRLDDAHLVTLLRASPS